MWAEDDLGAGAPPCLESYIAPADNKVYIMYHGTSREAAEIIKRSGFRQSSGGMLGRGVYLSRDLQKASKYPLDLLESQRVVLRVRVDVGKVKKIDYQGHPLQKTWHDHGYDTAWCPPNCRMVPSGLEEDCVWETNRITVIDESSSGRSGGADSRGRSGSDSVSSWNGTALERTRRAPGTELLWSSWNRTALERTRRAPGMELLWRGLGELLERNCSGEDSASSWNGVGSGVDSASSWNGVGSGEDSASSWNGVGSGVDSASSWNGVGSGEDSASSWNGVGSGVDSVSSWNGAGAGEDSASSWNGTGSGVDSASSWNGVGSGEDSASSWNGVGSGVDSVSSWNGAGSGEDSASSWNGTGSGVDSASSWDGAGSGVDSASSWDGTGSGVDSASSWNGFRSGLLGVRSGSADCRVILDSTCQFCL